LATKLLTARRRQLRRTSDSSHGGLTRGGGATSTLRLAGVPSTLDGRWAVATASTPPPPPPPPLRPQSTTVWADAMTSHERRVALQQRMLIVLSTLANGLVVAAATETKLRLLSGDVDKIATSTGQLVSLINLGNLLLGPIVSGLSDRFGRLPFLWLPVVGRLWWLVRLLNVRSIERYQEMGTSVLRLFLFARVPPSADLTY
jgi:hypothetical protein